MKANAAVHFRRWLLSLDIEPGTLRLTGGTGALSRDLFSLACGGQNRRLGARNQAFSWFRSVLTFAAICARLRRRKGKKRASVNPIDALKNQGRPRCHGEKMGAIVPLNPIQIDESQVGLVDQGGCLQRMPRTFPPQLSLSQSVQLFMDERNQLLERRASPRPHAWSRRVALGGRFGASLIQQSNRNAIRLSWSSSGSDSRMSMA
jgi:hypothetical protein